MTEDEEIKSLEKRLDRLEAAINKISDNLSVINEYIDRLSGDEK